VAARLVALAVVAAGLVVASGAGRSTAARPPDPTIACVDGSTTSAPAPPVDDPTVNPRDLRRAVCTHGPDTPEEEPALRNRADVAGGDPAAGTAAGDLDVAAGGPTPGIECYGDGQTGQRVQAVYARAADRPDRFAAVVPQIMGYAAQVEAEVDASAAETGGERHVRWVTTGSSPGCTLDVLNIALAAGGDDDFASSTVPALRAQGLDRFDRAYLVWMDADLYCGIGSLFQDTRHGPANGNFTGPSWSRVDVPCWGVAETHELGHNLGAVQNTAPNSNQAGHCRDEYDVMCYEDPKGLPPYPPDSASGQYRCADAAHDRRFDCNHDDYFHTDPPADSYLATSWNAADSPFLATTPSTGTEGLGAFHPVTPGRVYDGRSSGIGRLTTVSPHYVRLAGKAGIPAVGAGAIALNVTVTQPLAAGYLTISSADSPGRPLVSNINYAPGQTVANSAVITVPFDGLVEIFSSGGDPYVILDVAGWYGDASGFTTSQGGYHPLTPARLADTRLDAGGHHLGPASQLDLDVAGRAGVPASGASSVVLNVTGVNPSAETHLTAWPHGVGRPLASNLNLTPGAVVPNQVVVPLGLDGRVSLFNAAGDIDVVVDVTGWFDDGGASGAPAPPGGVVYHALNPSRVLDTREPGQGGALAAGVPRAVVLAGRAGVPASGAVAVAANLTGP
jgi:hypothetical protein